MNIKPAAVAACGVLLVSALGAQAPDVATADNWYNAVRGAGPRLEALLVENPAGVNLRDRRGGVTPLMHAAALGSLDTMRLLLDKGADLNAKSAAGATALMWAAADPAKVRLLVERGADVKAVSESGRTALLLAAMSDQSADTVRLLLERGADAKVLDREQTSTLAAAAYGNDTETVRQLLEAGAPVNQANVMGATPLMNAASNGNLEAVRSAACGGRQRERRGGAAGTAGEERHDRPRPVHAAGPGVSLRPRLRREDVARCRRKRQREGSARNDAADVRRGHRSWRYRDCPHADRARRRSHREEQRGRNRPRLGGQVGPDTAGGAAAEGRRAGHGRPAADYSGRRSAAEPRPRSSAPRRFSSGPRTHSSPTARAVRATRRTSPTSPSRQSARPESPSTTPRPASAPPARRRRSPRPRRGSTSGSTARRSTSCSTRWPGSRRPIILPIAPPTRCLQRRDTAAARRPMAGRRHAPSADRGRRLHPHGAGRFAR